MREGFETNEASRPWMQLDMGEEVTVKKVKRLLYLSYQGYVGRRLNNHNSLFTVQPKK